jgi:hypothetical protein
MHAFTHGYMAFSGDDAAQEQNDAGEAANKGR